MAVGYRGKGFLPPGGAFRSKAGWRGPSAQRGNTGVVPDERPGPPRGNPTEGRGPFGSEMVNDESPPVPEFPTSTGDGGVREWVPFGAGGLRARRSQACGRNRGCPPRSETLLGCGKCPVLRANPGWAMELMAGPPAD